MTPSTSRPARVASLLAGVLAATLLAVACGSSRPTSSPTAASPTAPATTASLPTGELTPVPGGATPSPVGPSGTPTQTDTAWGRIWDAVPDTFKRPDGASPADSIAGPVSAAFAVPGTPAEVTATMKAALDASDYRTDQSGPLEDGSFVLDSSGAHAGCQVQTTLTPLSGMTLMTILFGAGCPFE